MELEEAKKEFINLWGGFGSQWGINRSMAQVHAILLVSEIELSTDDIMERLDISRGSTNMSLRELLNWNLIYKVSVKGDRKEFFKAEKDMWTVSKRIVRERKRRELEPVIQRLKELKDLDDNKEDVSEFLTRINDIERLINRLDYVSEAVMKADEITFFSKFMKFFK